jgi:hypothetical protein
VPRNRAQSEAAQARIFNNVGAMLKDAFTYARAHLGMQTAVGTEAPRNSWYASTMTGDASRGRVCHCKVPISTERAQIHMRSQLCLSTLR